MHEAAHEADRGAADEEQEDEDVERGHRRSASGLACASPALTAEDLIDQRAQIGEFGELEGPPRP